MSLVELLSPVRSFLIPHSTPSQEYRRALSPPSPSPHAARWYTRGAISQQAPVQKISVEIRTDLQNSSEILEPGKVTLPDEIELDNGKGFHEAGKGTSSSQCYEDPK